MSIRIGIYDFFAYTIPGALYLIAVGYLATIFGLAALDFQWLANLAGLQVIALAMFAYIGGLIIDPIAMRWSHLFRAKDLSGVELDEFKKAHPDLEVKFQASDWPLLFAYIRRLNPDLSFEIDKHNATNIMLRNVSFGIALLAVCEAIQYVASNFFVWHLILCLLFVAMSIIAVRKSVRYAGWFYSGIYETVAASSLEATDFVAIRRTQTETVPTSSSGKTSKYRAGEH